MQLEQLQHPHRLAGGRHHPQVAVGGDQHESGGLDVEHVDATVGEQGQQLDHVEVGDEGVGQLDERPGEHRFSGHRTSSHLGLGPATVPGPGAWPRIVCYDGCWSTGRRRGAASHGGRPSRRSGVEAQRSRHHVVGHLGEGTVVAEGVRPQPDEGLADADVELGGDHARGLVHDVLEVGARLQLGGQLPGGGVRLQHEDGLGGDVGHDQGVGVLVVGERPRSVAYRLSAPRRTAPTWRGKPNTARTPASRAGPVKASHRGVTGSARSGSSTGRSWW